MARFRRGDEEGAGRKGPRQRPPHRDARSARSYIPEKVDVFWITQNYHDLHIAEYGTVDMAVFNKRVFDALKPGGTYFILDHQAERRHEAEAQIADLHRIEKAQVIR